MHNSSAKYAWGVLLYTLLGLTSGTAQAVTFKLATIQPTDQNTQAITIRTDLAADEYLYADYLSFTTNNPHARVTGWKSSVDATPHYDETFGETKRIIQNNPTLTVTLATDGSSLPADLQLLITYYTNKTKQFAQQAMALNATASHGSEHLTLTPEATEPGQQEMTTEATESTPVPANADSSWSAQISHMATSTTSWWFRIALAFILGLLLSLTPCIYPMIPITVGILQAQGSKSLSSNFLLALAYSAGLATTFALLGLGAAFAGHMVGTLLNNPIVIGIIVALLVYVALSLFGLYELYIPRSLRNRGGMGKSSYISAFLFGAASGTVASPCLSPGLILMLTLVATLKSVPLGFIMLFAFGFGLSMPLLLIGTFSSSLQMLPQAGMWMLEINYIFGFMMLAMALYFVHGFLAWPLVLALGALLSLSAAIFYFRRATGEQSVSRTVHQGMALVCIALTAFLIVRSATSFLIKTVKETAPLHAATWLTNYQEGRVEAQKQNRKLLVDVSAPMCSACEAVEKKVFSKQQVMQELSYFVAVKLNIGDMTDEARTQLMQQFKIMGAPTILLIDPATEKVVARWSSELAERPAASFIAELARYR